MVWFNHYLYSELVESRAIDIRTNVKAIDTNSQQCNTIKSNVCSLLYETCSFSDKTLVAVYTKTMKTYTRVILHDF